MGSLTTVCRSDACY